MKVKTSNLIYSLSLLLVLFYAIIAELDADEAEHIHFAWLNSLGYRPFVDYWQHHMPLIWDILAPIFLVSDNVSSTIAIRLITCLIVIISSDWALKNLLGANTLVRAIFVLSLIYPLHRLTIRPEWFAFPLYCFFLVDLSKSSQRFELTAKTSIIMTLGLLLTPRFAPLLIVYVLGYLRCFGLNNIKSELKKWLIIILPLILIIHLIYDIEDLTFFVLEQSSDYTFNYTTGVGKFRTFFSTYSLLAVFFIVTSLYAIYIKKNKALISLSFIQIILCIFEAGPYIWQATFLLSFLNFIFLIRLISRFKKEKLIEGIAVIMVFMSIIKIHETLSHGSLFSQLSDYQKKIEKCETNKTVQSSSFYRFSINSSTVHPIFAKDATYFGFLQSAILTTTGINRVVDYNNKKARFITYIAETEPDCLGSVQTFYKIKSIIITP